MSQKCRFEVVYSSSEDAGHEAAELNNHTPKSTGWSSLKFCEYPQELGLMLINDDDDQFDVQDMNYKPRKVRRYLTQVQLLVHEWKIASRVEVYVGVGENYQEADFERLGFMNLDGNERSNYSARELKTVYIDERQAEYIRLIVHRPHRNAKNLFHQVSLLAVNIVGQKARAETMNSPRAKEISDMKHLDDKISEYKNHDLAHKDLPDNGLNEFVMNNTNSLIMAMDPLSQDKLQFLMRAKADAIEIEDFDKAKSIKAIEHELKLLGVKLRKLDTLKQEAVRAEDYDYAKQVKAESKALRDAMDRRIADLHLPGFQPDNAAADNASVRSSRIDPGDDDSSWAPPKRATQQEAPFSARHGASGRFPAAPMSAAENPINAEIIEEEESEYYDLDEKSSYAHPDDQVEVESKGEESFPENSAKESRPFKNSTGYEIGPESNMYPTTIEEVDEEANFDGGHPLEGVPHSDDLPAPDSLADEQVSFLHQTGIVALLGEYRARCLFSKVFALRDAVMMKLRIMLQSGSPEIPTLEHCLAGVAAVLKMMVDDKIHQVVVRSVGTLEDTLRLCSSDNIQRHQVVHELDPVLTTLMSKLEDGNARTREIAMRGVDAFLTSPYFGPRSVCQKALAPMKSNQLKSHAWRPLVARMHLLRDIVSNFGINNEETGATTEAVMAFPKQNACFSHSNGDVRDAAKDLTTAVESVVGVHPLEPFLRELRPKQLEEYEAAFRKAAAEDKSKSQRKIQKPTVLTPRTHNKKASVATGGKVQTSAVRSEEREGITETDNLTQCMFCGADDPEWNEDSLDLHYWKDCTFLAPCPACAQVVEIAGLADHLLDECEFKGMYVSCEVTGIAIRSDEYPQFQQSEYYKPAPNDCFYCPLCYEAVPDSDEAWKKHITMKCTANTRLM